MVLPTDLMWCDRVVDTMLRGSSGNFVKVKYYHRKGVAIIFPKISYGSLSVPKSSYEYIPSKFRVFCFELPNSVVLKVASLLLWSGPPADAFWFFSRWPLRFANFWWTKKRATLPRLDRVRWLAYLNFSIEALMLQIWGHIFCFLHTLRALWKPPPWGRMNRLCSNGHCIWSHRHFILHLLGGHNCRRRIIMGNIRTSFGSTKSAKYGQLIAK